MADWYEYSTREAQGEALAEQVAAQLLSAIQQKGQASLAVPGGTTPHFFLRALAQQSLPWSDVTLTLTDERQVPMNHERSNARLIKHCFLDEVPHVHFIPLCNAHTENSKPLSNANLQEECQLLNQHLPLQVCVLGMGTDGHTASLFPKAKQLESALDLNNKHPLSVIEAEQIEEPRISMALASIINAQCIHVLIHGEKKREVWEQVIADDSVEALYDMPIRAVLKYAQHKLCVHYTA